MMKYEIRIAAVLLIAFLLFGCRKDDNNDNNNNNNQTTQVLKSLLIADAKTLYISSAPTLKSSHAALETTNKLFKITTDGHVAEVTYMDEKGDTIRNVQSPQSIYNISDKYVLIAFFNNQGGNTKYLVDKTNGYVYNADLMPDVNKSDNNTFSPSQKDAAGNIYYVSYDHKINERNIMKLDVSNPANLVVTRYSAASDQPWYFAVDNSGNMVYNTRFRAASGGFVNNPYGYICTSPGNDSIITGSASGNPLKIIFGFLKNPPLSFQPYGDSIEVNHFDPTMGNAMYVKFKAKNKVIVLLTGEIVEIYNTERKPKRYSQSHFGFTPYKNVERFIASDSHFYMLGFTNPSGGAYDRLVKVNPDDYSYTTINFSSEYEVYSIQVSSDDKLQVYALRLSDGNRVVAEINESGSISVLKVLDNETVTVLERIN